MEKLKIIGHPRLAFICALVWVLFALFTTTIGGASIHFAPMAYQLGYFLKVSGLDDLFHSMGFIFVLLVLLVNLFVFLCNHFPHFWKFLKSSSAPVIQTKQMMGVKKQEKYFYAQFQTQMGREEFRDLVRKWNWSEVRNAQAIRDEGGLNELQLAVQKFRISAISPLLPYLGMSLMIVGFVLQNFYGFRGKMIADQGIKTDYVESMTSVRQNWSTLSRFGQSFPGFYHLGFEIENNQMDLEYYPGTQVVRKVSSSIDFYQSGSIFASHQIESGHPVYVKGVGFFQTQIEDTGQLNLNLLVTDKVNEVRDQSLTLATRTLTELNGFSLKVLEVLDGDENLGLTARLQYQEKGRAAEEFWIFQKRPGYDLAHRKSSRFVFMINPKNPQSKRLSTALMVVKDPGLFWVATGAMVCVLGLFLQIFFPFRRYWFVWTSGKVLVAGWCENHFFFRKKFEKIAQRWVNRLGEKDPHVKAIKLEVLTE